MTLGVGEYELEEGAPVPVCVSLSNEIERDIVVILTTSSGAFLNPALGNFYLPIINKVVHCSFQHPQKQEILLC